MVSRGKRKAEKGYLLVLPALFFLFTLYEIFAIYHNAVWDGKSRFTFVVNSRPLLVVSLEPNTRKGIIFAVPSNTQMQVPYGYSDYPARAVYKLGELDKKMGGGKLLAGTVENSLGILTFGYIAAKNGNEIPGIENSDQLKKIRGEYFSLRGLFLSLRNIVNMKGKIDSNLTVADFFRIWNTIRRLRSDQLIFINLDDRGVLHDETLPDGTAVKTIDSDKLDFLIGDSVQDTGIRSESVTLELINAAGAEKLAFQMARILSNLGVKVIATGNADTQTDRNCTIKIAKNELKKSKIVSKLEQTYQCLLDPQTDKIMQADISVILGKGFIR